MKTPEFGKQIKELRGLLSMTQEALAYKLGVSVRTISRWEQGQGRPSIAIRRQLERLRRKGKLKPSCFQ